MYEAIDYTPSRLRRGESSSIVRPFMAHHQGMSLLSLAYLLLDKPMQRRFLADPLFEAAELLLQERVPRAAPFYAPASDRARPCRRSTEAPSRRCACSRLRTRRCRKSICSPTAVTTLVTSAGGGYSRWRDLAVTRWREDATRDCWGSFCYLRDAESGAFWSVAHQPTTKPPSTMKRSSPKAALSSAADDQIETYTQISVSPEDDIELRRVTLTNRGRSRRTIEITSYAEVVLAHPRPTSCIRPSAICSCRPS